MTAAYQGETPTIQYRAAATSYLVETYCKTTSRENEFKRVGAFESLDEAMAVARHTIDRSLLRLFKPGISREALFQEYDAFGDIPCIFQVGVPSGGGAVFNPLQYAIARSAAICIEMREIDNQVNPAPLQRGYA
jgi:hypothetical protein